MHLCADNLADAGDEKTLAVVSRLDSSTDGTSAPDELLKLTPSPKEHVSDGGFATLTR